MSILPSPFQHVATDQPWYERLSARTRQIISAAVAGFTVLIVVSIAARWYHRSQPAHVLEVIDSIGSSTEVQQESGYFTPQGKAVILWALQTRGDKPTSGEKAVYSAAAINGNTCDVPVRQGDTTWIVRLLKTDHWRFDDIYLESTGNKKVELWASYMKDHPNKAWWSIHGGEMFDAFCKGLVIGASAAK